jgi:hypothetical protein
MIPMIQTSQKRGKNKGALKKSRKVLSALVDEQLNIDKQRGLHLITPAVNANEQFTYHVPNPKGSPSSMLEIMQYYNDDDTLDSEIPHP